MKIDKLSEQEVLSLKDEEVSSIFIEYDHLSVKRLFEVMDSNPAFNERMNTLLGILKKIGIR